MDQGGLTVIGPEVELILSRMLWFGSNLHAHEKEVPAASAGVCMEYGVAHRPSPISGPLDSHTSYLSTSNPRPQQQDDPSVHFLRRHYIPWIRWSPNTEASVY
jgi:hypothetical protein